LQHQFLQDGNLPFSDIVSTDLIEQALTALAVSWVDCVYTPLITLCVFLGQVLSADHSCRAAVLDVGTCRYAGKGQCELGLLYQMWSVFQPGSIMLADRLMVETAQSPAEFLDRHVRGDWGELSADDEQLNDEAVPDGNQHDRPKFRLLDHPFPRMNSWESTMERRT
jgi:hypothetical protein